MVRRCQLRPGAIRASAADPGQAGSNQCRSRFRIRYSDDDIATNLSLQARIKSDFGIDLPDVPEIDELDPADYFRAVAEAVAEQPRWEVLPNDMVLWFFSFAKFLMYRDLDTSNWPEESPLEEQPLIRSLLGSGFGHDPPLCGDSEKIDRVLKPQDTVHVLDADSSQALVIEEVRRGRNLVIQGPPGTGKSQTIANLIAAAVKSGKTVLFVAEKMAALEVVERRLRNIGLEDMCLELHSNKANKRAVLQDLERTLKLAKPHLEDVAAHCQALTRCRDQITGYLDVIHAPIQPCGRTPYQVVGELVRLRAAGTRPPEFTLEAPLTWTSADYRSRRNTLGELVKRVEEIGTPKSSPWYGVGLEVVLPTDADRILSKLQLLVGRLEKLEDAGHRLASQLAIDAPLDLKGVSSIARLAQRLASAPPMDRGSMGHPVWGTQRSQIDALIAKGQRYHEGRSALEGLVTDEAWDTELAATRRSLAAYGRSWFRFLNRRYREAQATLCGLLLREPPKPLDERLALVDQLIATQKARRDVNSDHAAELGRKAFGDYWAGENSDWSALAKILDWETGCREAGIDDRFRQVFANLTDVPDVKGLLADIRKHLKPAVEEIRAVAHSLKLDLVAALQSHDIATIPLRRMLKKFRRWLESPELLSKWVSYFALCRGIESLGMAQLAAEIDAGATEQQPPAPLDLLRRLVSRCLL